MIQYVSMSTDGLKSTGDLFVSPNMILWCKQHAYLKKLAYKINYILWLTGVDIGSAELNNIKCNCGWIKMSGG